MVSGVHANINMHISHYYSHKGNDKQFENLDIYYDWVAWSEEWLKNMHFVYSFVLRAINREFEKLSTYNYAGFNEEETRQTKQLMQEFLSNSVKYCEEPFKEKDFFHTLTEQ